ncbi:MAG: DUF4293 domain-containing protein [Sphingobacteriales bacterium]|jgi:peptidoglycan/LPS O-acetylase OafA/YrhL
MIQRIQSLWFLLASVAGFLTYQLPLWEGRLMENGVKKFNATDNLLFFALTIAISILALATIFLFKNRQLQKKLSVIGILVSLGLIALEFYFVNDFKTTLNLSESTWKPGALMPILIAIFFFLALQGIRKDEKLIKSLDRLR